MLLAGDTRKPGHRIRGARPLVADVRYHASESMRLHADRGILEVPLGDANAAEPAFWGSAQIRAIGRVPRRRDLFRPAVPEPSFGSDAANELVD